MTEQSVTNANTKVDRTAKTIQRIVISVVCAGVLFVVVPPFLPGIKTKTVEYRLTKARQRLRTLILQSVGSI